ncbi:hypothetical protein WOLCODRAFT_141023 [Wolfiporia cocos MD-104 SS10]|uniref:Aminopeptidase n=1 Tax=Wolfiporia cocos (strain MD-104) TaxID=742152 RepID=A0A2H3JMJ8_WOLCO|nr:hypothetical protein WOLCODRAFT_141023 [Wolfiporia cocos MD-104 SS10]
MSTIATLPSYRLPTDVRPTHYDLTVRTDLENAKFDGIVKIDLDIKKETSTVVFNTKNLKLSEIALFSAAFSAELLPSSLSFDDSEERGILAFSNALPEGSNAQLKIAFEGELTGSMAGYYRSLGGKDRKEVYSLTQFEPTSAHYAFPCWDEPLLKATFTVTLISRADTVNLSNMSVASEKVYETVSETDESWLTAKLSSLTTNEAAASVKWKITRFHTSPPMSTYLVAYANGRFEYLESSYKSPLSGKVRPLRIYATADLIDKAEFALDVKRQVLPLYEQVFDIEFPLPKLDTLVASDFDAGAMENWGLITGRTARLLIDPKNFDLEIKKRNATTMCHEVAHMWFGDITTMEWWDNLYLNEGFATLMGKVTILEKVFPDWKLNAHFLSVSFFMALGLDAKHSSHPVEVECPNANMINEIFDSLSYHKAASVLRMLSSYVGEERFLKGVSLYLKAHLYANSVTKDLWDGIQQATGLDIPKMMDNWIKKIGYPVITVTETKDGIKVRQDRFLETGPAEDKDNETIWTIPLGLLTVSDSGETIVDRALILDEREKTISLDHSKPFKLNAGTVSFCRVLYSPERLVAIGQEASKIPSPLSMEDRMGLVDDALALAKAGFATVSSALSLIDVLRNEEEFVVWDSIATSLATIRSVWWEHDKIVDLIMEFERGLFGPIVKRLGYDSVEGESPDARSLRTLAVKHAALAQQPDVVRELTARFAHYMETGDDSRIPADFENAIYKSAVSNGGRAEWEAVKKIAQQPKTPQSGLQALASLGWTKDPELSKATFEFLLTDVRDQDTMYVLMGLSGNRHSRRFTAETFKEHYDALAKRMEGTFSVRFIVLTAFDSLTTEKDYEETDEFFKNKDTSKFRMALSQVLESIKSKAAWIKRSTEDVQQWLETRKSDSKF